MNFEFVEISTDLMVNSCLVGNLNTSNHWLSTKHYEIALDLPLYAFPSSPF